MLKVFAEQCVSRLASAMPLGLLHGVSGQPLVLPYYHLVSDGPAPHVKHLYRFRSPREFERDLDFLLKHYEPITLGDLIASVRSSRALPKRSFLLTFDDGFREMHDIVMPKLRAKGVPAVFFLISGCVDNRALCHHQKLSLIIEQWEKSPREFPATNINRTLDGANIPTGDLRQRLLGISHSQRKFVDHIAGECGCDFGKFLAETQPYLTSEQIRTMIAQGFEFGAHSIDHPLYRTVPIEEQIRQTRESMEFLVTRFGIRHRAFAFPHSDAGVAQNFLARVFGEGVVDVTFGTGGMLGDSWPGHFQRFTMEKIELPARRVVARNYARRIYKCVTGAGTVTHDSVPDSQANAVELKYVRAA